MADRKSLRAQITDFLRDKFDETRVVVWHDPSGLLKQLLRETLPEGVTMPAVEGGNPLRLRQAIDREDPWLERRWLLYVTGLADKWACSWLRDYESGFEHLPQADLSWALSRFFGLVETPDLRLLLGGTAAHALAVDFEKYFPKVPTVLRADELRQAVLRAAVHSPDADDETLVLLYLVDAEVRQKWSDLGLLPLVTELIQERLGLSRHLTGGQAPDRATVCRCMLASSLVEGGRVETKKLANHLPAEAQRKRWAGMLARGLHHPDYGTTLAVIIEESVEGSKLLDALDNAEALAHGPPLTLLDRLMRKLLLADPRRDDAWWQEVGAVAQTRAAVKGLDAKTKRGWQVVAAAAELLHLAGLRRSSLEAVAPHDVDAFAAAYVARSGDHCIDRLYRQIPQASGEVPDGWQEPLVNPARHAYHGFVARQTERFVTALERDGHYRAKGFLPHTSFWSTLVEPTAAVAVLCVDAMRADLAWELVGRLEGRKRAVATRPALAQVPTRTEVGMAALLPRAEQGFTVQVEGADLVTYIDGTKLPGVTERKKHYAAALSQAGVTHRREEVETFLADDARLLRECAVRQELAIGYTLDIDDNGDTAATLSWEVFDRALDQCERFVEQCFHAGYERVVVGADHGFLVRDPDASPHSIPGSAQKGGGFTKTFRYAAGVGTVAPELVPMSAAMLGRKGADVYVPRGTQCLAVQGGPPLFVHGGVSLQECALVFLTVTPGSGGVKKRGVHLSIEVPARVTSLLVSVRVVAAAVKLPVAHVASQVRVELRGPAGAVATSELLTWQPATDEQASTVTLKAPSRGEFSVALLTPEGVVLQSTGVEVDVMGEDMF